MFWLPRLVFFLEETPRIVPEIEIVYRGGVDFRKGISLSSRSRPSSWRSAR